MAATEEFPTRPTWLSEEAYENLTQDAATPHSMRVEVLRKVCACAGFDLAKIEFSNYFSSSAVPVIAVPLDVDERVGHLFYSFGFFKHVAEMIESGDEAIIANDFAILKDTSRPRRERRKVIERLMRAMRGKPIKAGATIWLYRHSDDEPQYATTELLLIIDQCLPWRLALTLASTGSEYVWLNIKSLAVQGDCRVPGVKDAGLDGLSLWRHGGETKPRQDGPDRCSAAAGLKEIVAAPPTYENADPRLGLCVAL